MLKYPSIYERHMTRSNDPNNLIPESPILVYPSLAATIGLEEATMLSVLTGVARHLGGQRNNGYLWFTLNEAAVNQLMPFWQPQDIQRIAANLREQGLLLIASAPYTSALQLKVAFNDKVVQPVAAPVAAAAPGQNKNFIAPSWQPDREILGRLAQHNIPANFAFEQVPEFVNYWRERGEPAHSWGSKFIQHTIRKWREFEAEQNARSREVPMSHNWRPSEEAMDVLTRHAGISRQFIEDAIPEFELYWREKGSRSDNWNKKFREGWVEVVHDLGEAIADPDGDVNAQRRRLDDLVREMSTEDNLPKIQWPLYGSMLASLDHIGRLFDDGTTTRETRETPEDQEN